MLAFPPFNFPLSSVAMVTSNVSFKPGINIMAYSQGCRLRGGWVNPPWPSYYPPLGPPITPRPSKLSLKRPFSFKKRSFSFKKRPFSLKKRHFSFKKGIFPYKKRPSSLKKLGPPIKPPRPFQGICTPAYSMP